MRNSSGSLNDLEILKQRGKKFRNSIGLIQTWNLQDTPEFPCSSLRSEHQETTVERQRGVRNGSGVEIAITVVHSRDIHQPISQFERSLTAGW